MGDLGNTVFSTQVAKDSNPFRVHIPKINVSKNVNNTDLEVKCRYILVIRMARGSKGCEQHYKGH